MICEYCFKDVKRLNHKYKYGLICNRCLILKNTLNKIKKGLK